MSNDSVNHPKHYCTIVRSKYRDIEVECLDVIEALDFNLNVGSAFQYIWRCKNKGVYVEDLKKARFYLDREIKRYEG